MDKERTVEICTLDVSNIFATSHICIVSITYSFSVIIYKAIILTILAFFTWCDGYDYRLKSILVKGKSTPILLWLQNIEVRSRTEVFFPGKR